MLKLALKMLIEDRAKFIAMILGLGFSSFIIVQQTAIFIGIMIRTYGFISDTSQAQIWIMDPKVQFVEDIKPLKDMDLFKVRSIKGIDWAVPMYKGLVKAKLKNGNYQNCILIGIDKSSLIGQPATMLDGNIKDLYKPDSIIINKVGALDKLALERGDLKIPMRIGDSLEINDHRAKVVGICKAERTFYSQPVIYTTYSRALQFSPGERKSLSFILAKARRGENIEKLLKRIENNTKLAAYTKKGFQKLTVNYYLKHTGIPINFGVAVFLGFIIGMAISGETFYNFINDNIRYLGLMKAMGASNFFLLKITLLQAFYVGFIGWGIGIGAASIFGFISKNTELSFHLPWQLLLFSGLMMFLICTFSCFFSLKKIFKLEPAIVFKA